MGVNKYFLLLLTIMLVIPTVTADIVVINSNEWQDVFSGALYARLNDQDFKFVYQKTQAITLVDGISPDQNALLIESTKNPVTVAYSSVLEGKLDSVELFPTSNPLDTNLDLATRIEGINNYIIVDDEFGYNAVAVAPYAIVSKSWVLLANEKNADEIADFLSNVDPESVMIYGKVDREVKDALAEFTPEIINYGNKYDNNIEIVKRFFEVSPVKQLLLANGEILESQIMSGVYPVLLIGTEAIPESIYDYLRSNDNLEVAIVIGYDLLDNARQIREETGIRVMVKFAQGRDSQFIALDMFPLPSFEPKIRISSAQYNKLTGQVEITYESQGGVSAYVKAVSHIISANGDVVTQVGDSEPVFVDAGEVKIVVYDADLTEFQDANVTVESNVLYGSDPETMEKVLIQTNEVSFIEVKDDSKVEIKDLTYDPTIKRFEVLIENTGEEPAFVKPTIVDLVIDGDLETVTGEVIEVGVGETGTTKVRVDLEPVDIEDNPNVNLEVRYGVRERALVNFIDQELEMKVKEGLNITFIVIAVLVMLLILFFLLRKKR